VSIESQRAVHVASCCSSLTQGLRVERHEPHEVASYAAIFVSARAVAAARKTAVLPLRVGTATIAD
jgi:hypothetical protein